ncbi:MAG: hypothetical protein GON13_03840 [Nanoarchaeota archaeon]|nr:hypothetical protein [Nanoarchaeota archaeon]
MRGVLFLFLVLPLVLLIISLGNAIVEYTTLYINDSYVIQQIQITNPENLLGSFDDSVAILQSTQSNNIFQGWEAYGISFEDILLENIDILSLEFAIRLNTSISWADDYVKLSYSLNGGSSWISVDNLQPIFSLSTYGNYSTSVSTISHVNNFRVKLQYLVLSTTDAELGDIIMVDGVEVYLTYNTSDPIISGTDVNITGIAPNKTICVNHTVIKGTYNISQTWITATYPNGIVVNVSTSNTTSNCGGGNSTYETNLFVGSEYGTLYINNSWVNDSNGNIGEETPSPNIPVLVRDDVLIVTLSGVPICFGLLYPNDEFAQANAGNNTFCSNNVEGFPMNISIEANFPLSIWLSSQDLTFLTSNGTIIIGSGNLSYSNSSDGNKTQMVSDFNVVDEFVNEGNSTYSVYWWLYLNRYLEEGNYTSTINVKVNGTY